MGPCPGSRRARRTSWPATSWRTTRTSPGCSSSLEGTRERLAVAFDDLPAEVEIVVHGSDAALTAAQPYLPGPAAHGRPGRAALPRRLVRRRHDPRARAAAARPRAPPTCPGSREMNLLAPAALYAQLVVGAQQPPPAAAVPDGRLRALRALGVAAGRARRSGSRARPRYARPAIARRLREGPAPEFPPGVRDAHLLGGTVFDLLARERGDEACARLAAADAARQRPRRPARRLPRARPRARRAGLARAPGGDADLAVRRCALRRRAA